jgi:heme exporter protein A
MTTPAVNQGAARLELRGLQCLRGDVLLFDDLNCQVSAGETLHVRGPNGSGKSTLLRMLAGLAQPDAGAVYWCGGDVRELGAEYGVMLNYVGHHNGIKLDLTARENLAFYQALSADADAAAPESALRSLGMLPCADLRARRLSAGQRRRLALARLLVSRAALWLLDEPFTSLDAEGRSLATALLQRHTGAGGIVIMATHEQDPGAAGAQRELRLQ